MAAGEQGTVNVIPGQPPAPPQEIAPPPDALAILRDATARVTVTPEDISGAMRHGIDAAPHYLGASLIARCTTTPEDFAASRRVEVLQARAAEYAKLADKAKTPAARARLPQPPPKPDTEDLAAHARYAGIRQQVSAHSQAFDERYHPGGKTDNEGISAFYDATEGLRHPALTALRTALDRDREERIRTTLIRTDRIVRFMVATAVSQETS